jgi:hypothetical protein
MTCSCGTRDRDAEAKVTDLLATAGLREMFEQTQDANRVMTESIRHLEKADRAAALGYGEDVVALHSSAGERTNRRCRRQFRAVIEAIDDRVRRDDWSELVAKARHEYETHEGPQQLEDARADCRAGLLDMDSLPSRDASQTVVMMDQAFDRVATDGLSGGMQLLRKNLENGVEVLSAPEMGRQPASPGPVAFYVCRNGALLICIIAIYLCTVAPFCWCCFLPFILAAFYVTLAGCAALAFLTSVP